ncbi:hypothetical protein [Nostoc sp. 'Peltigera membranacea cyanobiont' 232]|nr:hypothetical protein [Nostoc sp. 'Peltigera membranacea cyanobiont' 232]
MTSNKLFGKIFQLQQWLSTHPNPDDALQVFKDQLDYDTSVKN